jgi:hypothetical protein
MKILNSKKSKVYVTTFIYIWNINNRKPEAYTTEAVSISLDTAVDSIKELTIDQPIAIDETASLELIFKTGDPEEEPTLYLEPLL